ncbi:MAG TPA: hypothetical protein VNK89_13195 [Thermoflexus sp.]|nr:hypothetical protein [Thermoflexus sp.]
MSDIEMIPTMRNLRVYVIRLVHNNQGEIQGQVTEPATMRRWVFHGFAELRRILEQEISATTPDPNPE